VGETDEPARDGHCLQAIPFLTATTGLVEQKPIDRVAGYVFDVEIGGVHSPAVYARAASM